MIMQVKSQSIIVGDSDPDTSNNVGTRVINAVAGK